MPEHRDPVQLTAAHLFRHESGKMLAVLVRLFGLPRVEIAEDIVQDTLLSALETWKLRGIPENPRAWLYRSAKNRCIDWLRREQAFQTRILPQIEPTEAEHLLDTCFLEQEIDDAQLQMMFAACHPAIPADAQLILILKTLCGLSVREIAAALFLPDDTIAKRLYRAREKLRSENLQLEVPAGTDLRPRLDAVLQSIYLLFNEGYKSASDNAVIRRDLCAEALRLGGLLCRHTATGLPKTHALQSLMCFQAARFDARLDAAGGIITLEKQDRSRWNGALVRLAYEHLNLSGKGLEPSEYHLEAAIASYHMSAPDFAHTNWKAIYYCYNLLFSMQPSAAVALNRAIALGYAEGPEAGLKGLLNLEGLDKNPHYHAALGDMYRLSQKYKQATAAYRAALSLPLLQAERQVLEAKMRIIPE
jgi:RNA polymerase sigma factor (sigma-70 family)